MNFWYVLGGFGLFLAVFWFFVLAVLWHIKEFSSHADYSSLSIKIFVIISVSLTIISAVLFFMLPFNA